MSVATTGALGVALLLILIFLPLPGYSDTPQSMAGTRP